MLVKSENHLHIDHVMYQPQFKCLAGCKGCYIGGSNVATYEGEINTEVLDLIDAGKLTCEQFTVSLDTLYQIPESLVKTLERIWYELPTDIELCITAQNISSVQRYMTAMKLNLEQFLGPLTILSLSNMPVQGKKCQEIREVCDKMGTIINYNKCISGDMSDVRSFRIGCRNAHQVYLVLFKEKLGGQQNPEMVKWLIKAQQIALEENQNVEMDHCFKDALTHNKSGRKCGAGISKVAIWPDGGVSGCPYDTNRVGCSSAGKRKTTWESLQDIIVNRKDHPMDHCTIANATRTLEEKWNK